MHYQIKLAEIVIVSYGLLEATAKAYCGVYKAEAD